MKILVENGYFTTEDVNIIYTSPITSYIENPEGVFQCENPHCDSGFHMRYNPKSTKNIADIMKCPICGHLMINKGLSYKWSACVSAMKRVNSGTPETYYQALKDCPVIERFLKASLAVNRFDRIIEYQNPQFDAILEIAPMIFDKSNICFIEQISMKFHLKQYTRTRFISAYQLLTTYEKFYKSLPIGVEYKQTELKKMFLIKNDPTWIFYVWSNFHLMNRTKKGNRVYLSRINP